MSGQRSLFINTERTCMNNGKVAYQVNFQLYISFTCSFGIILSESVARFFSDQSIDQNSYNLLWPLISRRNYYLG